MNVFLLDLASGKKKELLKGDRKRGSWSPVQVAFGADPSLPSEHWIFAASEKGGLVAIDPSGRRGPKTLTAVREQASDPVLSPDGLYLAAVVDKTVRLWMTVTLREVKRFEYADKTPGNLSYGGNRLAFSLYHPDGRRLVVIEPESGVRLLDIPFQHPITSLALSRGLEPPDRLERWGSYFWNTTNIPWLRDKKVCVDLSFISLFAFRLTHLKSGSRAVLLVYRLLHHIAAWRWRHRWFRLPLETRLMNLVLLAQSRFSRSF